MGWEYLVLAGLFVLGLFIGAVAYAIFDQFDRDRQTQRGMDMADGKGSRSRRKKP